jgi:hypothetical protein
MATHSLQHSREEAADANRKQKDQKTCSRKRRLAAPLRPESSSKLDDIDSQATLYPGSDHPSRSTFSRWQACGMSSSELTNNITGGAKCPGCVKDLGMTMLEMDSRAAKT